MPTIPRLYRPKKRLGQHFLEDDQVAQDIASSLLPAGMRCVVEVGGGTGALTKHLAANSSLPPLHVVEIDPCLAEQLARSFPHLAAQIHCRDFLQIDLTEQWGHGLAIVGNFPYNISSPIFFSIFKHHLAVEQVVCMVQEEVARRLSAPPGGRRYGLLSVLLQAFYRVEYLFTVPPTAFFPPPKVKSGVIRLQRTGRQLPCSQTAFVQVVKAAFGQRRKMLRNALSVLGLSLHTIPTELLNKRAEACSVEEFICLTQSLIPVLPMQGV